jgi:hypothetical protein
MLKYLPVFILAKSFMDALGTFVNFVVFGEKQ